MMHLEKVAIYKQYGLQSNLYVWIYVDASCSS